MEERKRRILGGEIGECDFDEMMESDGVRLCLIY